MDANLYSAGILSPVGASNSPTFFVCSVGLCNTDCQVFEHTTEEFKVGKLDCINADVIAEFYNDELFLVWGIAWAEHVPVSFGGQNGGRGLCRPMCQVNTS